MMSLVEFGYRKGIAPRRLQRGKLFAALCEYAVYLGRRLSGTVAVFKFCHFFIRQFFFVLSTCLISSVKLPFGESTVTDSPA